MLQRYGQGPEDELPLESNGDYTREFGYLNFADYTINVTDGSSYDNLLNNIWFQPEEVFPIDGTPEEREHAFWVSIDPLYFEISKQLEVSYLLSSFCTSYYYIYYTFSSIKSLFAGLALLFLRKHTQTNTDLDDSNKKRYRLRK